LTVKLNEMGFRELPRESPYGKKHVVSKKKRTDMRSSRKLRLIHEHAVGSFG
jgi:hypothetical protein